MTRLAEVTLANVAALAGLVAVSIVVGVMFWYVAPVARYLGW